jgi:hypothetical protein
MNVYPYFIETKNIKLIELLSTVGFKGYPVKGTDYTSFDRSEKFNKVLVLLLQIMNYEIK